MVGGGGGGGLEDIQNSEFRGGDTEYSEFRGGREGGGGGGIVKKRKIEFRICKRERGKGSPGFSELGCGGGGGGGGGWGKISTGNPLFRPLFKRNRPKYKDSLSVKADNNCDL